MSSKRVPASEILARNWALFLLTGKEATVSGSDLEEDGRKWRKVLKALEADGFVTDISTKKEYSTLVWAKVTSKAFDALREEKPVFGTDAAAYERPGLSLYDSYCVNKEITVANLKWIMLHSADYTVCLWDSYGKKESARVCIGDRDAYHALVKGNSRDALMVADAEFLAARDKFRYDTKLAYVEGRNLAWGLEKQGLLANGDEDVVKHSDPNNGSPFGRGGHLHSFGIDPTKWAKEAKEIVEKYQADAEKATRRANSISSLVVRVEVAGGWEKFLAQYHADCVATLEEK